MMFRAEASVRYHRRRAAFLERVNLLMTLITVAAGGGIFVTLSASIQGFAGAAGLVVAIIGVIQMVYTPEACAAKHKQWLKRWSTILAEVKSVDGPSKTQLANWIKRQLEIEAECVGEMNALKADCFNRTMRALDREGTPYRLTWRHRLLMQVISFEHAFEE
jgi:hypothetical protein